MRCSVVFGVKLRLLVINISSYSPAINTAACYQQCVITCETVSVVRRRPCLQHLANCSVNTNSQLSQARYRLRIAISAYPHLHSTPPLGVFLSEYCSVGHGKTRMTWIPHSDNILMLRLFILTEFTNVTDRQTDRQTDTAKRHR